MTSMRDFFLYFKTFEIQFNCVGWIFLFYIALELFVALLRGSVLASLVAVLGSNQFSQNAPARPSSALLKFLWKRFSPTYVTYEISIKWPSAVVDFFE